MKKKPKVIHIITRLDMGGSSQNTLLSCRGLAGGYDLILVHGPSHESRMADLEIKNVNDQVLTLIKNGVAVITVSSLVRRINPLNDLRALLSIFKLMVRENPDIVHTHSSKAGILGRLAAKLSGVSHIIHTPHGHVFFGHFGPLASRVFLLIERLFDHMTDCLVALTEGEKQDYVTLRVAREGKIVKIHSGTDVERFMATAIEAKAKKISLNLNPADVVIGTVGWLLPIKGPVYLLRAMGIVWKAFPDVKLVYVGKGDLEERLKAEAARMGVSDRVRFLGWREDVAEIMQTFDVFVLPSLNEGMGRVIVEAMAAAKPVVASRVGGIPDLVKNGENGYLVKPADPTALADAIQKLLKSGKLRRKMGEKGRQLAGGFGVANMIEKLDHLYSRLLIAR